MKIPKDLGEFQHLQHRPRGIITGSGFKAQDTTVPIDGRFVPDDLLRERFAFFGEVKLTRDEVLPILEIVRLAEGWCNDTTTAREIGYYVDLLKSKLNVKVDN